MNDRYVPVYSTLEGDLTKKKVGKSMRGAGKSPVIVNANKQGVRIRRESKGRGGKNVCVIDGLNLSESALKDLGKRLKNKLGTGGSVKDGVIEIQGDHREALLVLLAAEGIFAKLAGG
ncbi:MAG: translation initiation factor [Zetaproteobacteria bacterium]|nr:translation initiation factor [Zetaproteobacteria bacterium]